MSYSRNECLSTVLLAQGLWRLCWESLRLFDYPQCVLGSHLVLQHETPRKTVREARSNKNICVALCLPFSEETLPMVTFVTVKWRDFVEWLVLIAMCY